MALMYQQGDIVVVKFPFTDGSEYKKRPALIISNSEVNKTNDYLIVQITSKYYEDGLTIEITNTACTKPMPLKSFIRTHKICTLHQSVILSKITNTNAGFLKKVIDRIKLNIEPNK